MPAPAVAPDLKSSLDRLADTLIDALPRDSGIYEGVVISMTRMPYRRLDFKGRALAYLRLRPKKGQLRIDVIGLWLTPKSSRLSVKGAAALASLAVTCEADAREAAAFLLETVEKTGVR